MDVWKKPKEGDLHSRVTVDDVTFELRYGYYEESERTAGEPFVLYPDLKRNPQYTRDGYRIVSAIQSVCQHYAVSHGAEREDCCYTCVHYPNQTDDIGVCRCEAMRLCTASNAAPAEQRDKEPTSRQDRNGKQFRI